MCSQKDIFKIAQVLINKHKKNAENIALDKTRYFIDKNDAKGAAVWLSVAGAIADLQVTECKGVLH